MFSLSLVLLDLIKANNPSPPPRPDPNNPNTQSPPVPDPNNPNQPLPNPVGPVEPDPNDSNPKPTSPIPDPNDPNSQPPSLLDLTEYYLLDLIQTIQSHLST